MKLKEFFIGIDSGGTNCRIAVSTNDAIPLATKIFNSEHYSITGAESFANNINNLIKIFLDFNNLDYSICKGICIGVAGARTKEDKNSIKKYLYKLSNFKNIIVESDTAIAFQSAFGDKDGLILICGTGSALFGKINGNIIRLGGWGKLLGDEGSAYSIGINFLKHLVKYFDESDETNDFEANLYLKHNLKRENLIEKIYHNKFNVASLAPFIIEMADSGNKFCINVIEKEILDLIRLFGLFKEKYKIGKNFPVAFTGSIIDNENYFSKNLKKSLIKLFGKTFSVSKEKINPLQGALSFAINKFK